MFCLLNKETLWRIFKGKWIRPQDYLTSDMLFYTHIGLWWILEKDCI